MPLTLTSPYRFPERIMPFGGAGSRKTTSVLEIARVTSGNFWVLDNDESYAYNRALETDFTDVADRVHVIEVEPDWLAMTEGLAEVTAKADRANHDWVVVDSISPAWSFVQDYITETIVGSDVAEHLAGLRRTATDLSDFHAKVMDQVPWQIIKKEYSAKVTRPLRRWMGNLILTAEAKEIGKKDDDQVKSWFKTVGVKPAGEGRLPYIPSSLIYLEKNAAGKFKMTTVKDRNRESVERMEFDDFGVDYLMNVAGWTRVKKQ